MDIDFIKEKVKEKYANNYRRYQHILGVTKLATSLAKKYHVDVEKAQVAALLHDYYKYESDEEMLKMIDDSHIKEKYKNNKVIYHAYASGAALKKVFGIDDPEIYKAIIHHVYGGYNMSRLEEIILIADYCEENRLYPDCVYTRKILDKSLYEAIYVSLDNTIKHIEQNGIKPLDEQREICENYRKKGNLLWHF